MAVRIKRVYEPAAKTDGYRILIDRAKYHAELGGSAAFAELLEDIHRYNTVTLLFGARDEQHNDAAALEQFLNARGGR